MIALTIALHRHVWKCDAVGGNPGGYQLLAYLYIAPQPKKSTSVNMPHVLRNKRIKHAVTCKHPRVGGHSYYINAAEDRVLYARQDESFEKVFERFGSIKLPAALGSRIV